MLLAEKLSNCLQYYNAYLPFSPASLSVQDPALLNKRPPLEVQTLIRWPWDSSVHLIIQMEWPNPVLITGWVLLLPWAVKCEMWWTHAFWFISEKF